jgi:hypothetical protein
MSEALSVMDRAVWDLLRLLARPEASEACRRCVDCRGVTLFSVPPSSCESSSVIRLSDLVVGLRDSLALPARFEGPETGEGTDLVAGMS